MCVLADSSLIARVCTVTLTTSTKRKKPLWRTIDWTRWCLLLLVLSPVSAVPVRSRRTAYILETAAAAAAAAAASETVQNTLEWEISQLEESLERPRVSRSMDDQPDDVANSRSRRETAHWSQPCTNLMHDATNTPNSLAKHILQAVSRALSYMNNFKTTYAQQLGMDWASVLDNYTSNQSIPFLKAVSQPLVNDFNSHLQNAYEVMQRLAVGIEQVTLDQALYQSTFLLEFRTIETHIVKILCELHYAMVHQELTPSVAVTKEIMGIEYRDLEGESARTMRDTIIVRDYDQALTSLRDMFVEFE